MLEKVENYLHKKLQDDTPDLHSGPLAGRVIAMIATDGFEQSELFEPKEELEKAGAKVEVVSLESGKIKAWDKDKWGKSISVDKSFAEASTGDYDCLVIPGGVINPDKLRKEESVIKFVESFISDHKPIAAICHGPQILIETDFLKNRRMTSYDSIKTDVINAGADWVDEAVVVDGNLITSRNPGDIPAFCQKMIEEFVPGRHQGLPGTEGYSVTL